MPPDGGAQPKPAPWSKWRHGNEYTVLRAQLSAVLGPLDLAAGAAGTHPSAVGDQSVSSRERHQEVYGSMRELAREPTRRCFRPSRA